MSQTEADEAAATATNTSSSEGYGMRIEPAMCVAPGRDDSRRLLIAWFVKKSFPWMLFGGAALASVVHAIERVDNEYEVKLSSPGSVIGGLLSAYAVVVVAMLLRIVIGFVALGLAFPFARAHDADLEPRTGRNRHWGTMSDRYKVAKAFRDLRWTHHVRQVALDRVSPGPGWWRRLDPTLDVVNVIGVVAFIITALTLATVSVTDLMM